MLGSFGLTIINKEKLEEQGDPLTGRPYRSFNWGVDDSARIDLSADPGKISFVKFLNRQY
ncbi:MAG TPA: hypothetical protein PK514_01720 [Spirochaetota bacterium]|nr:hypothetical protein [Spirochaetota bacterium]